MLRLDYDYVFGGEVGTSELTISLQFARLILSIAPSDIVWLDATGGVVILDSDETAIIDAGLAEIARESEI
jgi:tRNA A-37 threonylcarbamoyl transferase component Bud32